MAEGYVRPALAVGTGHCPAVVAGELVQRAGRGAVGQAGRLHADLVEERAGVAGGLERLQKRLPVDPALTGQPVALVESLLRIFCKEGLSVIE